MKTLIFLLLCPLAVVAGYTGGRWEETNPFEFYRLTPAQVHINESKKGLRGVREFKNRMKARAWEQGNDLPVSDLPPCRGTSPTTWVCDYRNANRP